MGRGAGDPLALSAPQSLHLSQPLWETMRAHVEALAPEEACGLVAGVWEARDTALATARAVIPVTNLLHSPVRFRMEPHEQIQAFDWIEAQGWRLLAIFHSHPRGPDGPSPTDLAEAYYPETLALIWSQQAGNWQCQGFALQNGRAQGIPIYLDKT